MSDPTVRDLTTWLDAFAPPALAEPWDNVGLLMGDPDSPVRRVMTCLTITPETAAEAIDQGAELIVSHHPIFFKPTRALRAHKPGEGFLWRLARAGIAVHSPHTAFDNTVGGINDLLAERLGLVQVGPLESTSLESSRVVVFTPEADRDKVLDAAFAAGAGHIGDYRECSFATPGEGTFFGGDATHPTVGQPGRRERVAELRLEFGCPERLRASVVAAVRAAHSYEEPAIDVYTLRPTQTGPGRGRLGQVEPELATPDFLLKVREAMNAPMLQSSPNDFGPVRRVAIACGAADDFLDHAIAAHADVFVTGEARFHTVLKAREAGVGMVLLGHYASERPGVEMLARRIAIAFPDLSCWSSRLEPDPLSTA